MAERLLVPCVSINPSYLALYDMDQNRNYTRQFTDGIIKTPKNNQHDGTLSKKAQVNLRNAISWFLEIAETKEKQLKKDKSKLKFKLTFATLTLPSNLGYDDRVIKSELVNQLFVELRKEYQVCNYVWKNEAQKNDKFHLHILLDKFIPYDDLRNRWNRIINKFGYIDEYKKNQQSFHKDGFRYRPELQKVWSFSQQKRAYKKGCEEDWQNPNSTDIHSVFKVRNIKSYFVKYFTNEKVGRPMDGRLWFVSRSLSALKNASIVIHNALGDEINKLKKWFPEKVRWNDFVTSISVGINEVKKMGCVHLSELFDKHVLGIRQKQLEFCKI
jgi:hypothetical protein